jgi:outer membrane cobalamin receptor
MAGCRATLIFDQSSHRSCHAVKPALLLAAAALLARSAHADDLSPAAHAGRRLARQPARRGRSASAGSVSQQELAARTVYRPGELLEAAPGLIVSQHSGEGKANQFYLRGFNLDHGTDLRTTVDDMPVNQRSHAHGQGWTDLNFLIPELAVRLDYKKGPYSAEEGDFASAGSASVVYANRLLQGVASVRPARTATAARCWPIPSNGASGSLLYALEVLHNDGPFTIRTTTRS